MDKAPFRCVCCDGSFFVTELTWTRDRQLLRKGSGWVLLSVMLLLVFVGFLIGYASSLRFIRNPRKALVWGLALGVAPLIVLLGAAYTPVLGIGSVLNFAFFALGPIMLIPILASSAALGMAGASAVLWTMQNQPRRVLWLSGLTLLGLTASLTVWPVVQREITKRQLFQSRETRAAEFARADFTGFLAGQQVSFPASPRLHVFDDCAPGAQVGLFGCPIRMINPVSIFTEPTDLLLNERDDPIRFRTISISPLQHDCRPGNDYCLTQEKVQHWCREVRPDQAASIWCGDIPAMQFELRKDFKRGPSDRSEPELSALFADTVLGPGRVTCFYSPDPAETDRQGVSCRLEFDVANDVSATLDVHRDQIIRSDPILIETIGLIPDYWENLTDDR